MNASRERRQGKIECVECIDTIQGIKVGSVGKRLFI
jgi:hypothetical protein